MAPDHKAGSTVARASSQQSPARGASGSVSREPTPTRVASLPLPPQPKPGRAAAPAAEAAEAGREKRRHDRFPVSLPATLTVGKNEQQLIASDVSFGGMFIGTDRPPALRNLVRIKVELPSDGKPILLLGMAVYVGRPGQARQPGVGIQFFGIDEPTRERWEKYVHFVRRERGGSTAGYRPVVPGPPERGARPELRLNAPSTDAMGAAVLKPRDSVLTIPSPLSLAPSTSITVILVHPASSRQLAMPARVVSADGRQLRVHLVDRDLRVSEIEAFIADREHITMDLDITVDDA